MTIERSRLIIYDLDDVSCKQVWSCIHLNNDRDDLNKSYGRMSFMAATLGDLEALQYLIDIRENAFVAECKLVDHDEFTGLDCISLLLALQGHWNALKTAIGKGYPCQRRTLAAAIN